MKTIKDLFYGISLERVEGSTSATLPLLHSIRVRYLKGQCSLRFVGYKLMVTISLI